MSSFSIRRSTKIPAFSVVQDAVLEHPRLSLNARTVLAWMLGRPSGWEIQIRYMLSKLNISENVWRAVKKDLVEHGFFSQTRHRNEDGKFIWIQEATDEPLHKKDNTTPHTSKTTHGSSLHDNQQIKQDLDIQNNSTIPPTKAFPPSEEDESLDLDLTVSHQLKKVMGQSKNLSRKVTSQRLADAMEASLRLGEATGNKVRIPIKLLEYLKKLSFEELEDRGKPILVEREKKKRQLEIKSSSLLQPNEKARVEGEKMIDKVRKNRHKNK